MRRRAFAASTLGAFVMGCVAVLGIEDTTDEHDPRVQGGRAGQPPADGALDLDDSREGSTPTEAAAIPACDFAKPFGAIASAANLNTAENEEFATLSPDLLTIYLSRSVGTSFDLFSATRATPQGAFGSTFLLTPLNSTSLDYSASTTPDGLTIYFASDRPGGQGGLDLYRATRLEVTQLFGLPVALAALSSPSHDTHPYIRPDGSEIYFSSGRSGKLHIYRAAIDAAGNFGTTQFLSELTTNAPVNDGAPVVSADGRTLFFATQRALDGGASTTYDIYVARRASTDGLFDPPVPVAELNSTGDDLPQWVSPDGCTLYFSSTRAGGGGAYDLYSATRPR